MTKAKSHRNQDPATVERALHSEVPPPPSKKLPRLLTRVEVAVYLRVTTKTLRRWTLQGKIKPLRLGSERHAQGAARLLFTEAEVLRFIRKGGAR